MIFHSSLTQMHRHSVTWQVDITSGLVSSSGVTWVRMHAGKPEDVVAAHARVCKELGDPEVLVYNAGPGGFTWPPPAALDISPEAFTRGFDSGVTGALVWAQQVLMHCPVQKCFQQHNVLINQNWCTS